MPVRMTDLLPQTSSGAKTIGAEVGDIIAEASFDAELDLTTALPIERPIESRDFTQVGQILQKMLPLEVQMEGEAAEVPIIDVELPAEKPMVSGATIAEPPQMTTPETPEFTKPVSVKDVDVELRKVEGIPLEPTVKNQTPSPISTVNVAEKPPAPEGPFAINPRSNSHVPEQPVGQTPEMKLTTKHAVAQPEINPPRNDTPVSLGIAGEKLPEPKTQTASEVLRDLSDFGTSIADKPQVQRPLPPATSLVHPTAYRPQVTETKIVTQISTAISNTSKDTVEIRLDPPELGRVTISITQTDSGVSATVTSEKAEISDLLRRHAELLSRELSKSGFSEASLEFSHREKQQGRPTFEGGKAGLSSDSPEQAGAAATIEMIIRSQSGSLDIRL